MTATMEELNRICDSIKSYAEQGKDIGNLGFELIETARALRDNPLTPTCEEVMKKLSMLDCPVCHAHTLEPFTTAKGENVWYCKSCGALYADQNDTPGEKLSKLCPECGKQITLNDSIPGACKHWKCRTCKLCLADDNGKPVPAKTCPSCGKKSYSRFELHKAPGHFFWGCSLCKHQEQDQ